jgi:hypothetical protein
MVPCSVGLLRGCLLVGHSAVAVAGRPATWQREVDEEVSRQVKREERRDEEKVGLLGTLP